MLGKSLTASKGRDGAAGSHHVLQRKQQARAPTIETELTDLQRISGNQAVIRLLSELGRDESETHSGGSSPSRFQRPGAKGVPLEAGIRGFAERRLGHDLSRVRLHTDIEAGNSAEALGAAAFAFGRDVVFAPGHYAPGTPRGLSLLMHELAHTVQDSNHSSKGAVEVVPPGHHSEVEASAVADLSVEVPRPVKTRTFGPRRLRRALLGGQPGASRPTDRPSGAGLDVMFILRAHAEDTPSAREYIEQVTQYVTAELKPPIVIQVDTVKDMFDELRRVASGGRRVQRIRIVGHGGRGKARGTVLMHYPEPSGKPVPVWVTPHDIKNFARDPAYEAVVRDVMAPDAVVEFWGCNLGAVEPGTRPQEEAGTAWATLFQARFKATPERFWIQRLQLSAIPIPAGHGERGQDAQSFATTWGYTPSGPPLREPGGSWAPGKWRAARNTAEIRAAGPQFVTLMQALLYVAYQRLVAAGEIAPVEGSPELQESYMEKLFDQTGGQIRAVVIRKGKELIAPSAWNTGQLWNTFSPVPFRDLATGKAPSEARPKAPPTPPPVARPMPTPPAAAPAPPVPPVPESVPAPAVPPVPEAAPAPAVPPISEPAPEHAVPPARQPRPTAPRLPEAPAPAAPPEAPRLPAPKTAATVPSRGRVPSAPPEATPPHPDKAAKPSPAGEVFVQGILDWILWNFAVGSHTLLPAHTHQLTTIARDLAASTGILVQVNGHASRSGSQARNQELSELRAKAVQSFLVAHGIDSKRITIRAAGDKEPWDPEAPAGEIAHDRRVEVRLYALPSVPKRTPLPEPRIGPAIEWHESPTAAGEAARTLPGYSIEGKIPFELPPVPLGSDWLLIPEFEVGLKLELTTAYPMTVANSLKEGKLDYQIKVEVAKDVVVTASLVEGKASVQFKGLPMKPELEFGLKNLLADPEGLQAAILKDPSKLFKIGSLKFTLGEFKTDTLDFGRMLPELKGIGLTLKLTPKAIVSLAPSPFLIGRLATSLAARLGPRAGIVGGAIVGGIALTILAMYLINRAHQQGERWAEVVNLREGYARRLAAEAADWRPGRSITTTRGWDWAQATILKARYHGGLPKSELERTVAAISERTYAQEYDGWQTAEQALRNLPESQYDAAMAALRQRFGTDVEVLASAIFERIGGIAEEPIALPSDPTLLH